MTDETFDVILHVDEAKAPLARGQEIAGRIIAMVSPPGPDLQKGAVFQPVKDAPYFLLKRSLFMTIRHRGDTWDDLKAGRDVIVNVSLLDPQENELAAGIGTLKRIT
jgi:hypothetical protein